MARKLFKIIIEIWKQWQKVKYAVIIYWNNGENLSKSQWQKVQKITA